MAQERVIAKWIVCSLTCVLWHDDESPLLHGGVRNGRASLASIQLPEHTEQRVAVELLETLARSLASSADHAGGPWRIDAQPITDMVMIERPREVPRESVAHLMHTVKIADDLSLIPIAGELCRMIRRACDPPGVAVPPAIDGRGRPLYAFVRARTPRKPVRQFDGDRRLQLCIALSRLIRPTSASFRYAVRIVGDIDGRFAMYPGPVRDQLANAWTPEPTDNFLTTADMGRLGDLIAAWDRKRPEPKSRVNNAFWMYQYAAHTYLVDIRWQIVATALETLLSTSADRSTTSFLNRVPSLARALALPEISRKEASRMWGLRSALVHGARHGGLNDDDFALYGRMEELLRVALRESVLSPTFRATFDTIESINAVFPLPAPAVVTVKCPACKTEFAPPAR